MKTILILITVLLISAGDLFPQVSQEWTRRYTSAGDNIDYATDVAVDAANNVYVTGAIFFATDDYRIATIKYSSAGIISWTAVYTGGYNYNQGTKIKVDASGNVYVTGNSYGNGSSSDYITIKYNSAGTQLWAARYNGAANSDEEAEDIEVDGSGNVYVTGFSIGSSSGRDYATIKYNSAGLVQWIQRYNGPASSGDEARDVTIDGSGNVYITGRSYGSGSSDDYATIKYNSAGVQQWVQRYNGPGNLWDYGLDLAVDGSGNVYVTGQSIGSGSGWDYATLKYNSAGVLQWATRYNGPGNGLDEAPSLAIDGSGNVYVTGYSVGSGTSIDYATIKYNTAGVQQWTARYNGPGNSSDGARALTLDAAGNIYVTGYSTGIGTSADYLTLRYSPAGTQVWEHRYNGSGNAQDLAMAIAVSSTGIVYVAGESYGSTSGKDYLTIKYSQTVGIQSAGSEIPSDYSLGQNYPNPFNPVTNIKLHIPKTGFVSLKVYDISGKESAVLVSGDLAAGIYNVDFDASHLASGVYFYRLETEGFMDVKKMMLVK